MKDYKKRIWIAEAPAGVWSSGPRVVYDLPGEREAALAGYDRMDWTVTGPYLLEEALPMEALALLP